jgi:hypothetical protein
LHFHGGRSGAASIDTLIFHTYDSFTRRFDLLAGAIQMQLNPDSQNPFLARKPERVFLSVLWHPSRVNFDNLQATQNKLLKRRPAPTAPARFWR